MARGGKKSLAETVNPNDIVDLGEELNSPNIIIDDNFGISGKYADYALVQKKVAHRTGTKEDGENEGRVIRYIKWEDVSYNKTIFDVLRSYRDVIALSKIKSLNKCQDYKQVEMIYKNIETTINNLVSDLHLSNDTKAVCDFKDTLSQLRSDVSVVKSVLEEANSLMEIVKEKKKLIMKV